MLLARLTGMPHSLDVKDEHLILSSVLPAVFHGAETRPLSGERISKFRSKMVMSLFGTFHLLSPAIALLLTGRCILDLEFWLIMKAFLVARKYLFRVSSEKMDAFLRIASVFQGGISKARGPAATLSFYLTQLGWSIDGTGQIHLHALLSFHLLRISYKRLLRFAVQAWQDKLMTVHTQRFSLIV